MLFLLIVWSDSQRELELQTQFHHLRSNRFESFRVGYKFSVVCGASSSSIHRFEGGKFQWQTNLLAFRESQPQSHAGDGVETVPSLSFGTYLYS